MKMNRMKKWVFFFLLTSVGLSCLAMADTVAVKKYEGNPSEEANQYRKELGDVLNQLSHDDQTVGGYSPILDLRAQPPQYQGDQDSAPSNLSNTFSSRVGTERTADPNDYILTHRGFPANQDVFFQKNFPYSQLWLKDKGWIKSVAMFVDVGGKYFPLRSLTPVTLQEDNRMIFHDKSSKDNDYYLASSASINLASFGNVFRVYVPTIIGYGTNPYKTADLFTAYDKVILRLYSQPHGEGRYKDVLYYLKDKLGVYKEPTLKELAVIKRRTYDIVIFEYRNYSINMQGIKISENDRVIYSIFANDLIGTYNNSFLHSNSINLVQWLYDSQSYQSIMRFAVILKKQSSKRYITTTLVLDSNKSLEDSYTVAALQ